MDKNIRLTGEIYESKIINRQNSNTFGQDRENKNSRDSYGLSNSQSRKETGASKFKSEGDNGAANRSFKSSYRKALDSRTSQNYKRYKTADKQDAAKISNIFFKSPQKTLQNEFSNTRKQSIASNIVDSANTKNVSGVTAKSNNAEKIASLQERLKTADPAETADILHQLQDLLNMEYSQEKLKPRF